MTINQAVSSFESNRPKNRVLKAYAYKGGYLLFAPDKETGPWDDTNDPYFFVNKSTGEYATFIPLMDFEGFDRAVNNNELQFSR